MESLLSFDNELLFDNLKNGFIVRNISMLLKEIMEDGLKSSVVIPTTCKREQFEKQYSSALTNQVWIFKDQVSNVHNLCSLC